MTTMTMKPVDTVESMQASRVLSQPDPQVAVELMLAEAEITRAQMGLGPACPPQQPMLRDLSPFGR